MARMKNASRAGDLKDSGEGSSKGRRPGKEPTDDGDADFDLPKLKKINKGIVIEEPKDNRVKKATERKDNHPILRCRTSPNAMSSAIKNLNEIQKQEIKDIGFGCILKMKHTYIPQKMLYWIIDNFNVRKYALKLPDRGTLRVTENDVHYVLGLPKGNVYIQRK